MEKAPTMTTNPAAATSTTAVRLGELLVSLGFITLGGFVLMQAQSIGIGHGYEQIGPRLFPGLIGAGLSLCGLLLALQALGGGWRSVPLDESAHEPADGRAFLWLSAALVAQLCLIGSAGFVPATTLLFVAAARGFGSRRLLRDLAIGAVLALAVFLLFTRALGLTLPASLLGVL